MADMPASIAAARGAIGKTVEPWREPIPLGKYELPAFPIAALPKKVGAYVAQVSGESETPLDLGGMLVLSYMAGAVQRRYVVQTRGKHQETLSVWTLTLMSSGERKSSVSKKLVAPIKERQQELIEAGAVDRARAFAELKTAEARKEHATKEAGKKRGSEATAAICEREEATEEVARLERDLPPIPRMVLDDVTPEQFGVVLSEVGSVLIASTEGGVFGTFFGRHNNAKMANLDLLLKSHNGEHASVSRVSREHLEIVDPACSIGMATQPDVLAELARERAWMERGGAARIAYAMPEPMVGKRTGQGPEATEKAEADYRRVMLALLPTSGPAHKADRPAQPFVLRLAPDAAKLWEAFSRNLEPRLDEESGDLGWMNSWGGKLPGLIARIAAIFQLVDHGPSDVGADAMERALMLAPYFEAHAVAALSSTGERQALKDARQLLGHLVRERPVTYLEREAYRRNFGQDTKRSAAAHALLEEHGWIRNAEPERHDSTRWETHPQIRQASAVSAISRDTEISVFESSPSSTRTVEPNQPNGGSATATSTAAHDPTDSAVQIPRKRLTLLTVADESAPRFEEMPDAELDRFAPVTASQLYDFKHEAASNCEPPEGAAEHDALLPLDEAEHHLAEPVDWDAR